MGDIYEALTEGKRMDTVFLDFAKAFDKIDHNMLLEKVKKHGIGGKIGRWRMEFLRGRKFRVVANRCMSRKEVVISGVRKVQFWQIYFLLLYRILMKKSKCVQDV